MKKKLFITGATGYLGSNLVKTFIQKELFSEIIVAVRSSSSLDRLGAVISNIRIFNVDKEPLDLLFNEKNIDIVVHCATNYGRKNNDNSYEKMFADNVIFPEKIFSLAQNSGVQLFVNTDTVLDRSNNNYALTKALFRDTLKKYHGSMIIINMSLEHFYGPFDDDTKFVGMLIKKLLNNDAVIPLTSGEQQRDFVYIDDVVDAYIKIIQHYFAENIIDTTYVDCYVGTGRLIAIRSFVELVQEIMQNRVTKLDFGALPFRLSEKTRNDFDKEFLKNTGWFPKYTLGAGVNKIVESLLNKKE